MLLLEKVFEIINNSGLDYCIQNKYEIMPEKIPSDIDMMYRNASEADLDKIVQKIAKETELLITQKIVQSHYEFTYILSYPVPNSFFQLQLDFYETVSFGKFWNVVPGKDLLDNKRFYKCFFIPSPYDELRYLWIRRTIKNKIDYSYIEQSKQLIEQIPNYHQHLKENFGNELANIIVEIIKTENLDLFVDKYQLFFNKVMEISKMNINVLFWLKHFLFRISKYYPERVLRMCGMSIALLAPDGAGKSTVIKGISDTCLGSFYGIEHRYFRPRKFKNLGSYNRVNFKGEAVANDDPHGKKLHGVIKSLLRFLFYNLDFLFGYLLDINKLKMQKKLIIFDRYYYDYFVDMERYQYRLPKCFPAIFQFMIPNPDLVLILDAPAEIMYSRKKELPLSELGRQREGYLKLQKKVKHVVVINADQPIKKVIEDATQVIIERQADRIKRILKCEREKH